MCALWETSGNAGDCVRNTTASPFYIFREMSQNKVVIPIGQKEPGEFLADLHAAIYQAKLMIFERRELDLMEPETYALYVLTDLQQRIVAKHQ